MAVFDDRIEVRSTATLPAGTTLADLSGPHISNPMNPLMAEAFHLTGAVEVWGSGTNRVVEECIAYGIEPPEPEEWGNAIVVAFRAAIGPDAVPAEPADGHVGTKSGPSGNPGDGKGGRIR